MDATTPIDRQIRDFKLIYRAMAATFDFDSKPDARRYFAHLRDNFYQKNYCKDDSTDYTKYEEKINKLLKEGVASA